MSNSHNTRFRTTFGRKQLALVFKTDQHSPWEHWLSAMKLTLHISKIKYTLMKSESFPLSATTMKTTELTSQTYGPQFFWWQSIEYLQKMFHENDEDTQKHNSFYLVNAGISRNLKKKLHETVHNEQHQHLLTSFQNNLVEQTGVRKLAEWHYFGAFVNLLHQTTLFS